MVHLSRSIDWMGRQDGHGKSQFFMDKSTVNCYFHGESTGWVETIPN